VTDSANNPLTQAANKAPAGLDDLLVTMAGELAEMLRRDANIGWQFKENVRSKLRH